MSEYFLFEGRRFINESLDTLPETLWRVKTDKELGREDRPRMPQVFVFLEQTVALTREWQLYLVAINYGMTLNNISGIMGYTRAFCNQTGLGNPDKPRRNYVLGESLDASEYPKLDKIRTCGNSFVKLADGYVVMMDGTKPPPLKPGQVHPLSSPEAKTALDRYLYSPRTHPHLFLNAVTTRPDFEVGAWPGAAIYDWTGDNFPRCFVPHVAPVPVPWPVIKTWDNKPTLVRV